MEHGRRHVIVTGGRVVVFWSVPLVAAVVRAADHACVIFLLLLGTYGRLSYNELNDAQEPSWNMIVPIFSHTFSMMSSSYTGFPLGLANRNNTVQHVARCVFRSKRDQRVLLVIGITEHLDVRRSDSAGTFFTLETGYALHVLLSVNFSMRNPSSSSGFLY